MGVLTKLRGRTPAELRTRLGQAIAAASERAGVSRDLSELKEHDWLGRVLSPEVAGAVPDAHALGSFFRSRQRPPILPSFADREATIATLRCRWPHAEPRVLARAANIRDGRFDLLGYSSLDFGTPPDWHLDSVHGRRSPAGHWSQIPFLDAAAVGDHKVIWELNRNQFLLTLGQAYWLSDDEAWAETFVDLVTDWIEANPPKMGINWASSLELAFRSISWIWALEFFRDSPSLTSEVLLRVYQTLYLHGRHIETHLSTYFSPNTHLTGEALGLVYLAVAFPEFRCSARWFETGVRNTDCSGTASDSPRRRLFRAGDSVSTLHGRLLPAPHGTLAIAGVCNFAGRSGTLEPLFEHLMNITGPDGITPRFGDADGGRLLPMAPRAPGDFRDTLSSPRSLGRAETSKPSRRSQRKRFSGCSAHPD